MDALIIVKTIKCLTDIWDLIKKFRNRGANKHTPQLNDEQEKKRKEQIRRLNENIKRLRKDDIGLQCLAVNELEQIAADSGKDEKLQEVICISLCQYLSSHPDSRPTIDALFKKGSIFVSLQKEIKGAKFINLKLSTSHTVENVDFVNCEFHNCHFHRIHFRNCKMHGVIIYDCYFKDGIKISGCNLIKVDMQKMLFRHAQFTDLSVRDGKIYSSTAIRSEFQGVSFIDMNWHETLFKTCEFQNYDFYQVKMNDVKFEFKKSNTGCFKDMFEYLCHIGQKPSIECDTGTIVI